MSSATDPNSGVIIGASFLAFLAAFTAIGVASVLRSRGTRQDYYLASSQVAPWLAGLSAVATNNSGYMFIGVIGYTYTTGLASVWLMTGWILGDLLASLFVHGRLQRATARSSNEASYAGVLASWHGSPDLRVQRIVGLISLIFLLAYAGAQLLAGSKALQVLFDWPAWAGATLGAVMVVLYCFAGGIRASIWTDAAQSLVMVVAMALLLVTAVEGLGGTAAAWQQLTAIPGYTHWLPEGLLLPGALGATLFVVGWLFAGFSVIGQPHVMVRFMALQSRGRHTLLQARLWYYLWFTTFYCLATAVGLMSRLYLPDTAQFDAELALPSMALMLMPPVLVGLILAGIFAATMSTADSLVLACSAALTQDLMPAKLEAPLQIKLATVGITGTALALALANNQSVFSLVILAWSGLASAFAPLLVALCLGARPDPAASLVAIGSGLLTALIWRALGWHEAVYEGMPGILCGLGILGTVHWWQQRQNTQAAATA